MVRRGQEWTEMKIWDFIWRPKYLGPRPSPAPTTAAAYLNKPTDCAGGQGIMVMSKSQNSGERIGDAERTE